MITYIIAIIKSIFHTQRFIPGLFVSAMVLSMVPGGLKTACSVSDTTTKMIIRISLKID